MREIVLHDTLTGELLPLRPRDAGRVGIYACGPTVYSRIHIGNARPFVVFSLLERFLEHEGYEVRLVINVTDVNDKIYDAARAQGRASAELAAEMTEHYRADTDALGLGRPDHEPLASETMGPIVDYIETLIAAGHAYPADGDVYFRVRSDPVYGSLSHRQLENMDQGEEPDRAPRRAQGGSARLRAVEGAQAGRGHRLGVALGAGATGLAHRVLGHGRAASRGRLRHPRRRLGPGVPPPRERGRPDARARAGRSSRDCGCTTA